MRIAHLKNIANLAWRLAEGQRKLGHEAVVYARDDRYGFPRDVAMPDGPGWNVWMLGRLRELREFDVIHVHGGVWRGEVAYRALAPFLPPIFVQYNGGEARRGGGLHWQGAARGFFYTDPDIKGLVPGGAVRLPLPIDTGAMNRIPTRRTGGRDPVFAHFPTGDKGTEEIIGMFVRAFGKREIDAGHQDLVIRGDGATLWVFFDVPHAEVLDIMANTADVVIDQVTDLGIYATVSVEAMALGKPALSTIDRSLYPPSCPVVRPSAPKLMELARDAGYRKWLGERGREYVARVHDARRVAEKTIEAYEANL